MSLGYIILEIFFSALPPVLLIKTFWESFNLPSRYPLSIVLSMKTVAMHMGDSIRFEITCRA